MPDFFLFSAVPPPGVCLLTGLDAHYHDSGGPTLHGRPRAAEWKPKARVKMDPSYKRNKVLADCLSASGYPPVVSAKLRAAFEENGATGVEFLPVTIVDHAKKVAAKDYFVVNPTRIVDGIDLEASKVRWNTIDTSKISGVAALRLRADAIPSDAMIFRLARWEVRIVVRKALADALAAFTGVHFHDPEDFRG